MDVRELACRLGLANEDSPEVCASAGFHGKTGSTETKSFSTSVTSA